MEFFLLSAESLLLALPEHRPRSSFYVIVVIIIGSPGENNYVLPAQNTKLYGS